MTLIPLFQRRQDRQFEKQLRPHLPALYRYAYRLCGSRDDAEDIVQDLLTRLYEKQVNLESLDNRQSWLLKVLYRQFVDWQRKARRTPSLLVDDNAQAILSELPHTNDSPESVVQQDQLQLELQQALARLNQEQRILILLHDVEGFTLQELQEVLDTPVGTLKSRLHRGRARLREIIHPHREPFTSLERDNG